MLDMSRTRIERSYEMPVLSTDVIAEAGLALTSVLETDIGKARRSNATNNANFLGFSWGNYLGASTVLPTTQIVTAGAANSSTDGAHAVVALPNIATGQADMLVLAGATDYGTGTVLAPVSNATNYSAVTGATYALNTAGTQIIVPNAYAGLGIFISMKFAPTANYMRLMYGDMYLPNAALVYGRIGIITRGTVYTNNFDSSIDWSTVVDQSTANQLRCGANGMLTVNSNGGIARNTYVVAVPTPTSPFLGLHIGL